MSDLVCFGEAMLRLCPADGCRLEQMRQLDVHVGGSEFNVAVGAARLGLNASWITSLPENALGRLVRNKAREHGVAVEGTVWRSDRRLGLYFVEKGAAPRPSAVLYDRAHSAMADLQAGSLDWPKLLRGARAFHTSGITAALGAGAAQETLNALRTARELGCLTSYDLNYRRNLWTPAEAARVQRAMLRYVDLLITTEEDAHVVFGIAPGGPGAGPGAIDTTYARLDTDKYAQVARELAQQFEIPAVAITMRKNPSVWHNAWSALVWCGGNVYRSAEYELEVVDRIGAGDSFAAGLLAAYLKDKDWEKAVPYAVAFSALKHSIPGDVNWATDAEVHRLLADASLRVAR